MKATGVVRKVDELGRIVIPKSLRTAYGMSEGEAVEIFTTEQGIQLRKYQPGCTLCSSVEGLTVMAKHNKLICNTCVSDIKGGAAR